MGGIRCKKNPTHFHIFHASVVHIVYVCLANAILTRLWVARKHPLQTIWAAAEILFVRQPANITVRHSPEASFAPPRDKPPGIRVHHVVTTLPTMLFESIVPYLDIWSASTMTISATSGGLRPLHILHDDLLIESLARPLVTEE